jgi:hypothetical protein
MTLPTQGPEVAVEEIKSYANRNDADIATLAYALWQQRGCPEGSPEEDWVQAERQLHGVQPV